MKKYLFILSLMATVGIAPRVNGQDKTPATLRSILLEQFQTTWDHEDWFVPVKQSLEGLSAKQAMWKPSDSSHSVGELAYHLLFWNKHSLDKFNGKNPPDFTGNNTETFTAFTEATWASTVQQLAEVMKEWEAAIRTADEAKLKDWYSTIAHISAHNAYHTGQILYIRKLAGNWDAAKGVR
ncbi:MAG TPA: DinB family protein [Puia sp.]|nr:DinB family protein [Puia sp.]